MPELVEYVPESKPSHHSSHTAIVNTVGCYDTGTLDNVPQLHCGCLEMNSIKAHHKFHVSLDHYTNTNNIIMLKTALIT